MCYIKNKNKKDFADQNGKGLYFFFLAFIYNIIHNETCTISLSR